MGRTNTNDVIAQARGHKQLTFHEWIQDQLKQALGFDDVDEVVEHLLSMDDESTHFNNSTRTRWTRFLYQLY